MHRKHAIASGTVLLAASLLVTIAPLAVATSARPTVQVRIEGRSKTLLASTPVQTGSGFITKYGATPGKCPASSAQGALDSSTMGHWVGTWSRSYNEYFITSILGDTESGKASYWEVFVNNVAASSGACEIKLHRGDKLLFAAAPTKGAVHPIGLRVPKQAAVGRRFRVTVLGYDGKGVAKPLPGATVKAGSHTVTSNSAGVVKLTLLRPGSFGVRASKAGYIRDAAMIAVGARSPK